jgi:hypothetical protein
MAATKIPSCGLLHCGVFHRVTPPRAIIDLPAYQVLRNSSDNLAIFAAIRRASSLVSNLAARARSRLIFIIDVRECLSVVISYNKIA